ncbi:MAG TPA: hypothetical protein PLJ29_06905 [Leptospiraceae bacterium]|nr:hypothetical protein [Leptospiraceae bacterium]
MKTLMQTAGTAHICLVLASLSLPFLLRWKEELAPLKNLYRQMFWTYSAYTAGVNLFFGIISIAAPEELLSGTVLAFSLNLFICIYWTGRVLIQFFCFDTSDAPKGLKYTLGEWLLVFCFISFSAFYGTAAWMNFMKNS